MKRKTFGLLFLTALLIGIYFAWTPIKAIYFAGVPANLENKFLYIPTGSTYEQVIDSLSSGGFVTDLKSFRWLAAYMKYERPEMRAGRYEIEPGWNNRQLIRYLRGGKQAPVNVILTNQRLPEEVAGRVAQFLEVDSLQLLQAFRDPAVLTELGYTPETLISLFIPNTYQMFWNTDAKGFLDRMVKEHDAFWDKNNRREKAAALDMTPEAVYTLASIVERETNNNSEKPTIAGVYLNRLKIDMPLQADPTSVFATRDFATRRVTDFHTTFDSPYNTYRYKGLPPGPISMASIASIDAVLNPQQHDYLYFCAKPDDSGSHSFAETYTAHLVNARRFQTWLQKRGY
ncbi:MAG: endolytic transglycosylase MltG [Lewinellaceae bacterium]|nr:endolytic transglycosylase MltG [Lewinellaceae bacterium]